MNRITLIFCVVLFSSISYCQRDSFYDDIQLGEYCVGYCDTVLFDDSLNYSQFNYEGPAPLFVQIWHPLVSQEGRSYLTYGDFRSFKVPPELDEIHNELSIRLDSAFIRYNISEEYKTWKEIDYKNYSLEEILGKLKTQKTKSSLKKIRQDTNFPVIVYHHGNQGPSDENYLMAEYFASRGYVFVSANFELPFAGHPFGFREGGIKKPNTSTPKKLIQFARSISKSEQLFYIGHSYGAQVGFCILHKEGLADAFVSMETTMEFKWPVKPLEHVKNTWPILYNTILEHQKDYQLPMLMIADTRENPPFTFFNELFKDLNHQYTLQVSSKRDFGHESYTSVYFLRYLNRKIYKQPDSNRLKGQLKMYIQNLELIESFLKKQITNQTLNLNEF
ncbi:MAG: alpha/beta hydrolase, partial [Crocinitomicaceae bacterium]|nr:alpha/beta hydrolase [Crocinitomicaceae bacterium]